ncbi:MAG: CRISPR-associated endonuclease Cas2 [Candidatus Uhrbacteria bacterium]|nr:CRISPR-associated endonuclease Cas2 [Candidatus Uhrbacteria bacterium]
MAMVKDISNEDRIKRGEVVKMILLAVGVSGVLVVGAVCPGLFQLVKIGRRSLKESSFRRVVYRLDKKGWLVLRDTGRGYRIDLTSRGRAELQAYELGQKAIQIPKRWDQKWRVLVFDIPETRRHVREKLRHVLKTWGFYRLQDSVWVHPYECSTVLELLRTKYGIRHEALYLLVEHLDQDHWLRKHFYLVSPKKNE